jgi:hypothetical protein
MTAEQLWTAVHALREAWIEFGLAVRDHPDDGDNTLLVRLKDEADDGYAAVNDALTSLVTVEPPERALAAAHAHLDRARDCYWRGAGSVERRIALRSLGGRRGGEWTAWVPQVELAGARIPMAMTPADEALRGTWLELAAAAAGSQQIKATRGDAEHG